MQYNYKLLADSMKQVMQWVGDGQLKLQVSHRWVSRCGGSLTWTKVCLVFVQAKSVFCWFECWPSAVPSIVLLEQLHAAHLEMLVDSMKQIMQWVGIGQLKLRVAYIYKPLRS